MFSLAIVLLQDEFDTYRTTFYPECISSRSIMFLMETKGLSDTCFGSDPISTRYVKKAASNLSKCQQH